MTKRTAILIGVVLVTVVSAVIAFLVGERALGRWLAAPSIVLSGWAAFGHLVTVDDDMAGGWSNPERSRSVWGKSLSQLAIKFAVFAGLLWLFSSL
jgi:hypothetical protein